MTWGARRPPGCRVRAFDAAADDEDQRGCSRQQAIQPVFGDDYRVPFFDYTHDGG